MKRKIKSVSDQHQDWLAQIDTEGPFLALPVVKDMWPQGVDRLGDADDRMITFKQAAMQWQRALDEYTEAAPSDEAKEQYGKVNRAWIELVLDRLAGWQDLRVAEPDARLADVAITSPGGEIAVRPSAALEGRDKDLGALLLVSAPTTDLRATGLDGWAATEIDRMAMLLRKARVEVGIVTDGQWWAVVWAKDGKPTGSGVVDALTWAEEPLLRDAFLTLIDQRRFRAKDSEQRLPHLFERSELEAEVITEALGTQVRKSVELLVQAFSEARLAAVASGAQDPLAEKPDDVYQAAVTIMMRVVFLLFAEERDMLPTEQLYWSSYAISDLLDNLQQRAADGEEHLDESFDAWHRLLAVSEALYGGVNYDEMRMPAYGGSLLDPNRFAWLHATDSHGLGLKVSDRVMLHVFDSVQSVVVKNERRRITFRDIDVEQIGYIYEGLLGYTCQVVDDDIIVGLVGKDGEEPEIPLRTLQQLYDESTSSKAFANALTAWVKLSQPSATLKSVSVIAKLVDMDLTKDAEAEYTRLLTPVADQDRQLLGQLVDWGRLIRRDLRGIPYVVPFGGLIVNETPSRKNAGAHYTPRALAEEVVRYALEPLVYEPGPLETNDNHAWRLKSSTAILDLKVADIAAGSGAFLVAAARFLADRITEAWTAENMLRPEERANPGLTTNRAVREVIARCLYGADINPMAVEMCKLSLWLISMDRTKPFSFVDDKVFCGNSLLGITSLDQLRAVHVYPDPLRSRDLLEELIDVDTRIAEAIRLRKELASPIDDNDPMRSKRGKLSLLEQYEAVTADLSLVAEGIIAMGLPLGGKKSGKLDDQYKLLSWGLAQILSGDGSSNQGNTLLEQIDRGLTPTVPTDYRRWKPLHWVLVAPDVMLERGGFDAIVGNPPFLYGREIGQSVGVNVRNAFINWIADGVPGVADLCVYFLRRAADLLDTGGVIGLVATNTVTQGPSRIVGLEALLKRDFEVRRSTRSMPWPTDSAAVDISLVWLRRGSNSQETTVWADGVEVSKINSRLEPVSRVSGDPLPLDENLGAAFKGSNINGLGFLMTPSEASAMLAAEPNSLEVLFPYMGGEDLNAGAAQTPSRWTVNFFDMSLEQIKHYPLPYEWLLRKLHAYRMGLTKKPRLQERWWIYESRAKGLYEAIAGHKEVLAISAVTKHLVPSIVPADSVFSHGVIVFQDPSPERLALLSSEAHVLWAWTHGSNLETRLNYNVSTCFEAFPAPNLSPELARLGSELNSLRGELMGRRNVGLTDLYNLVCDPETNDNDIVLLRRTHEQVDHEVMSCYGWHDVQLKHGFTTYKRVLRWTIAPDARSEVLDRLLELNHQRARNEGRDVPDRSEVA